ncbi:MAG TPA: hypothetical protein VKY73_04945, partial [Polyangiaceae bacterium]|nr:hypothetical protein [Polyangiaceae bacterium]
RAPSAKRCRREWGFTPRVWALRPRTIGFLRNQIASLAGWQAAQGRSTEQRRSAGRAGPSPYDAAGNPVTVPQLTECE